MGLRGTRSPFRLGAALLAAAAAAGCASISGEGRSWEALLQIGTGAQGGNGSILRLDSAVYQLPIAPSEREFPFADNPGSHDPARWYVDADSIPSNGVLVVEAVDIVAAAPGDRNGHGEIRLAFPDGDVFRIVDEAGPYRLWLAGRALVPLSRVPEVMLEAADSSAAEVRLYGRVLTPEKAAELGPAPFVEAEPRGDVERAGGKLGRLKKWTLDKPRVLLQVRAGAISGNPARVHMLGRGSGWVARVLPNPLNMEREIRMSDDAIGFAGGARIPAGKVWVITRVSYEGRAGGDSNGAGEFLVQAGGEVLARADRDNPRAKGVWEGRIEVRPGEESGVFVQVRNSSTGSATFEGAFE